MEEMQRKIDEARAAYRETLDDSAEVQDAAWAAYMDFFFQVSQFNKANGTKILPHFKIGVDCTSCLRSLCGFALPQGIFRSPWAR